MDPWGRVGGWELLLLMLSRAATCLPATASAQVLEGAFWGSSPLGFTGLVAATAMEREGPLQPNALDLRQAPPPQAAGVEAQQAQAGSAHEPSTGGGSRKGGDRGGQALVVRAAGSRCGLGAAGLPPLPAPLEQQGGSSSEDDGAGAPGEQHSLAAAAAAAARKARCVCVWEGHRGP